MNIKALTTSMNIRTSTTSTSIAASGKGDGSHPSQCLLFVLVMWLKGGEGGSVQTLYSEQSELRRAEHAKAREAAQSSRMRAVVYLTLGTGQAKPHTHNTN